MNARIVDLDKAPVNGAGRVEAWANFMVLRPKKSCETDCVGLLEVSNRGGKAALAYFNSAPFRHNPDAPADFGDGFLMRQGLTVIWVGWQFDVPEKSGLLRLNVPVASNDSKPIRGLVRSDWTVERSVKTLSLGHRGHIAYPVADPKDARNVLSVRDGRLAPRKIVPREKWHFARGYEGQAIPDRTHVYMPSGFQGDQIYELVYLAEGPAIVGLGLAAVRDMMSYAKYEKDSAFHVDHGIAFGVSQTGRFLRHFIYQGFNTDEMGRKVFDGMLIHTAGAGRGSFNHRFAQPSRDAHRYSAFFYPTDLFPFTGRAQRDQQTGNRDGLYAHQHNPYHSPKVFYTNTGYEYWGRAASLIHTSVDGRADVEPLPNERIYHLASGQHFVGRFPLRERLATPGIAAYRGNPLDFLVNLRALLIRLVAWVTEGRTPPESRHPRIDESTLVSIAAVRFPVLAGIDFPQVIHEAYRVDYGPRWQRGIINFQPPMLGKAFPSLVADVDRFGNELGGVRNIALRVPVATYAPWNLRADHAGARTELTDFLGTFIPLPRNEEERSRNRDPRPSLERLYPNRERFLTQVRQAAEELVAEGFLLREDIARVTRRAARYLRYSCSEPRLSSGLVQEKSAITLCMSLE
ncbi:MAG: alpha/beta hydrolase domain-containing protein [Acidiferrobacterales bacterium]